MRKLNPSDVADWFEAEVDLLLDYYDRVSSLVSTLPTGKSDLSKLTEQVFVSAAVSFEGALSDIYFAYTNKDSSLFIATREKEIKELIEKQHGTWYADKFALGTIKHIRADELYPLLDPRGFNITFYDAKKMVRRAKNQLASCYATKYTSLSASKLKLIDAIRYIRNCIAHQSDSSYDSMRDALEGLISSTYRSLGRTKDKRVNSVGAYLKATGSTDARIKIYLSEMKAIVSAVGR